MMRDSGLCAALRPSTPALLLCARCDLAVKGAHHHVVTKRNRECCVVVKRGGGTLSSKKTRGEVEYTQCWGWWAVSGGGWWVGEARTHTHRHTQVVVIGVVGGGGGGGGAPGKKRRPGSKAKWQARAPPAGAGRHEQWGDAAPKGSGRGGLEEARPRSVCRWCSEEEAEGGHSANTSGERRLLLPPHGHPSKPCRCFINRKVGARGSPAKHTKSRGEGGGAHTREGGRGGEERKAEWKSTQKRNCSGGGATREREERREERGERRGGFFAAGRTGRRRGKRLWRRG